MSRWNIGLACMPNAHLHLRTHFLTFGSLALHFVLLRLNFEIYPTHKLRGTSLSKINWEVQIYGWTMLINGIFQFIVFIPLSFNWFMVEPCLSMAYFNYAPSFLWWVYILLKLLKDSWQVVSSLCKDFKRGQHPSKVCISTSFFTFQSTFYFFSFIVSNLI